MLAHVEHGTLGRIPDDGGEFVTDEVRDSPAD